MSALPSTVPADGVYVPDTAQILAAWRFAKANAGWGDQESMEVDAEFYGWLTQRDREVRKQAAEEVWAAVRHAQASPYNSSVHQGQCADFQYGLEEAAPIVEGRNTELGRVSRTQALRGGET